MYCNKIFKILDSIPFGKKYFEIGLLLRDTKHMISSMLFTSEGWYNLTEAELNLLETIDLKFVRKLLHAPMGTPKEMLYLELGVFPFDKSPGRGDCFVYTIS